MPGNAPVVRAAEVDLVSRPFANALGQRRAAVLREGRRVEHAVRDSLVLLPRCDAKTDHVGVDLDADIGLTRLHAVPFAIANEAPARQPSVSKSSCTTAHQPTENGEAELQSIERKRIHSAGTSNGRTTCRLLSQQSKNAPKVTDQSPSSHAETSSLLPEARKFCL